MTLGEQIYDEVRAATGEAIVHRIVRIVRVDGLVGWCSCGSKAFDLAGCDLAGSITIQKWAREDFERHAGRSVALEEIALLA